MMRRMLFAAGALLAVALMPAAPAAAAGFGLSRPDTAGLASEVQQVHQRRHHRRHRGHVHRYRYSPYAYRPYAYRYYAVPRYAYRPYYYSTWKPPYGGVYLAPAPRYYRHW